MMQVVNPKATKTVEVMGGTFTVGIIPYGKRTELEASTFAAGEKRTTEEIRVLLRQNYEFVRWGVKSHAGLAFQDGSEARFVTQKEQFCGQEYDVVSEETMAVYCATVDLLSALAKAVSDYNYLDGRTAKN